tara:strand:- start:108 stop:1064 length:957 start_codon:yes stop_codon:yes gene_type:complete
MVMRTKITGDERFLTQETGEFSPEVVKNLFFPEYIYYRNKPKEWPYGKPNFNPAEYKVVTMDELVGWAGTPDKVNLNKLAKLPENKGRFPSELRKIALELEPADIGGNSLLPNRYREEYMRKFKENFKKAFVGSGEGRSVYICKKGVEIHRVVVGEEDEGLRILAGKKKTWAREDGKTVFKEGGNTDNKIILGVELGADIYRSKRKTEDIPSTYRYRDRDGNIQTHNYVKRGRTLDGVWLKAKPDKPSAWERGDSKWQQLQRERTGDTERTWFEKQHGFVGRQFMNLPISNKRTRDKYLFLVHKHGLDRLGIFNWVDL